MSETVLYVVSLVDPKGKFKLKFPKIDANQLTGRRIKRQLNKINGIPENLMILKYKGQIVGDDQTGAEIGLANNETLILEAGSTNAAPPPTTNIVPQPAPAQPRPTQRPPPPPQQPPPPPPQQPPVVYQQPPPAQAWPRSSTRPPLIDQTAIIPLAPPGRGEPHQPDPQPVFNQSALPFVAVGQGQPWDPVPTPVAPPPPPPPPPPASMTNPWPMLPPPPQASPMIPVAPLLPPGPPRPAVAVMEETAAPLPAPPSGRRNSGSTTGCVPSICQPVVCAPGVGPLPFAVVQVQKEKHAKLKAEHEAIRQAREEEYLRTHQELNEIKMRRAVEAAQLEHELKEKQQEMEMAIQKQRQTECILQKLEQERRLEREQEDWNSRELDQKLSSLDEQSERARQLEMAELRRLIFEQTEKQNRLMEEKVMLEATKATLVNTTSTADHTLTSRIRAIEHRERELEEEWQQIERHRLVLAEKTPSEVSGDAAMGMGIGLGMPLSPSMRGKSSVEYVKYTSATASKGGGMIDMSRSEISSPGSKGYRRDRDSPRGQRGSDVTNYTQQRTPLKPLSTNTGGTDHHLRRHTTAVALKKDPYQQQQQQQQYYHYDDEDGGGEWNPPGTPTSVAATLRPPPPAVVIGAVEPNPHNHFWSGDRLYSPAADRAATGIRGRSGSPFHPPLPQPQSQSRRFSSPPAPPASTSMMAALESPDRGARRSSSLVLNSPNHHQHQHQHHYQNHRHSTTNHPMDGVPGYRHPVAPPSPHHPASGHRAPVQSAAFTSHAMMMAPSSSSAAAHPFFPLHTGSRPSSPQSVSSGQALLENAGVPDRSPSFAKAYDLLQEFARDIGVGSLAFDENSTAVVALEGNHTLLVTFDQATERLFLYSTLLVNLPANKLLRLRLYEFLLEGAILGRDMAGGGVGVSVKNDFVLMASSISVPQAKPGSLRDLATVFVDAMTKWRDHITNFLAAEEAHLAAGGSPVESAPTPTPQHSSPQLQPQQGRAATASPSWRIMNVPELRVEVTEHQGATGSPDGVVVVAVTEHGPGAKAGLAVGDVITAVNRTHKTHTTSQLRAAEIGKRPVVDLTVTRQGHARPLHIRANPTR